MYLTFQHKPWERVEKRLGRQRVNFVSYTQDWSTHLAGLLLRYRIIGIKVADVRIHGKIMGKSRLRHVHMNLSASSERSDHHEEREYTS